MSTITIPVHQLTTIGAPGRRKQGLCRCGRWRSPAVADSDTVTEMFKAHVAQDQPVLDMAVAAS